MEKTNTLIIGAGIFGLTAALALHRRGHSVAVLDAGPVPHPLASSTDISKVVRVEYGPDEAYMALAERARAGWLRWNEEFGEGLYHEDGVTMLTQGPMAPGGFAYESFRLLQKRGHPVERLDQDDIGRRFPAWNAGRYTGGYFNPIGGYAKSGKVVTALAGRVAQAGISRHTGSRVQRLVAENGHVTVVLEDGQRLHPGRVVIAAGAWTPSLLPELAGVMQATGHPVFHLKPENPDLFRPPHFHVFSADVSRTGWYGFPLHPEEGVVKIAHHGPGREVDPDHDERRVTDAQIKMLRAFLDETFPALRDAPLVYTRLCLYCDVRDGHFWIDRHPHKDGVIVAAGGSGHGFKFAPILGDLIADAVEGRPNPDLDRFRWRTLGANVAHGEATRYLEGSDG